MGYYLRYVVTDERDVSPALIEAGLKQWDSAYSIADGELLKYGEDLYGRLEINRPGDGLFDEEREELTEGVQDHPGAGQERVLSAVRGAKAIVAFQVLWQGRGTEDTMEEIDPLWGWLFAHRVGLPYADGEGYYDQAGLILAVP